MLVDFVITKFSSSNEAETNWISTALSDQTEQIWSLQSVLKIGFEKHFNSPQILSSVWQQWTAAWTQPKLATSTMCARNCAPSTCQHASSPPPRRVCVTDRGATRPCGGSSTACLRSTPTSCCSALAATWPVQRDGDRPSCPAAPMREKINPAALPRWGSVRPTMFAGQFQRLRQPRIARAAKLNNSPSIHSFLWVKKALTFL